MFQLQERLAEALQDRYRIERKIGEGGMALVFLAEDLKHHRKVALKVLRPEVGHQLGVDRFLREIRIAAVLSHPNILPLFDSGEADGLLYYVMPFVEGPTLAERLSKEGPLGLEDAVDIVEEVGEAVSRAHDEGVLHRDIKPENVLFESGHVRVADFGLARALDVAGGERLTRTGLAVGTPHYMSPEQVDGNSAEGVPSDVYSLGCLLYELLAGEPPYTGSTAQAVVAGHLSRPVPSVRAERPSVPRGVEAVIHRALAKDPADRFASVEEMLAALRRAMTAEARDAEERRAARRRWTRALVAVGGAAAVTLGGWWMADALTGTAMDRLAVLPASNMTRDAEQEYFVDGVHEALITELQRAGIPVIARQSVLRYRDSDKSVRQIADELGVDALIQPAVGREGDSVVVDVVLLDASSEVPIWTETFGSRVRGVLGLYREMSSEIADEIGAVLSEEAEARLAQRPTVDPQVLEDVFLGRAHLGRFTPEDFQIALDYFRSALERDSLYAPAHVGMASVWQFRAQARLVSPVEVRSRIDEHLERALELDPELAEAWMARGANLFWNHWSYEEGMAAIRRSLELDPNAARAQVFYGHTLMIMGRWEEARERGRRAVELEPLDPFVKGLYGTVLTSTGRHREAVRVFEEMFEANPGARFGLGPLGSSYGALGRTEEEYQVLRREYQENEELLAALEEGMEEGGLTEAKARAADLLARRHREPGGMIAPALTIAAYYAAAGQAEESLDWLERALELGDQNLPYMGLRHRLVPLYGHPRFQDIVEEVGVPLLAESGPGS